MLFARTRFSAAPASVDVHLGITRGLTILATLRHDAVYDSRFLPPTAPLMGEGAVVYVLLEGSLVWHSTGATWNAPAIVVVRSDDFEGAGDGRGPTYRLEGQCLRSVQLHVPAHAAAIEGPRAIDDARVVTAAQQYHAHAFAGTTAATSCGDVTELCGALIGAGILTEDMQRVASSRPPTYIDSIWQAFANLMWSTDLGATLGLIADGAHISERHANRLVGKFLPFVGLDYLGWRDATHRWRIRAAILLLSNPSPSVEAVAAAVGFSSATALWQAFRGVGLPNPLKVRAQITAGLA